MDLVTSLMALHHMEDPDAIIVEISRVLRPGGVFIIREHDCDPPELAISIDVMHGLYGTHECCYHRPVHTGRW